jgi:hypothetical protein
MQVLNIHLKPSPAAGYKNDGAHLNTILKPEKKYAQLVLGCKCHGKGQVKGEGKEGRNVG